MMNNPQIPFSSTSDAPHRVAGVGESARKGFSLTSLLGYLVVFAAVFFTAIVQSGFFVGFRPLGAAPDLCLALSVAVALRWGAKNGAVVGIMSGVCLDAFTETGLSLLIPFYFMLTVAIGLFAEDRNAKGFVLFAGAISLSAILRTLLSFFELCLSSPSFSTGKVLTGVLLPNLLITVLFSPILYFAVLLTDKIFGRRDRTTRR